MLISAGFYNIWPFLGECTSLRCFLQKNYDWTNYFRGPLLQQQKKQKCQKAKNWKSYSYLKRSLGKRRIFAIQILKTEFHRVPGRGKINRFFWLIIHRYGLLFHVGSSSNGFWNVIRVLAVVFCRSRISSTAKMKRIWKGTLYRIVSNFWFAKRQLCQISSENVTKKNITVAFSIKILKLPDVFFLSLSYFSQKTFLIHATIYILLFKKRWSSLQFLKKSTTKKWFLRTKTWFFQNGENI